MLNRDNLHDYQEVTAEYIYHKRRACVWLSLGLGKTVSAATAVSDLMDSLQASRTLIVAPKLVARFSWVNELENWEQLAHLTFTGRDDMVGVKTIPSPTKRNDEEHKYADTKWIRNECKKLLVEEPDHCDGNTADLYRNTNTWIRNCERDKLLKFDTDICIINVDNFQWLVETMRSKWPWDTVIIDESSMFRTHSSGRFKSYKKIAPYVNNLIELSATPAPNSYLDLWTQIYMIDSGERLGKTYTAYRNNFFEADYSGFKYVLRPGMKEIIDRKISDVVISMDAGDHLGLEEAIFEDIILDLPNKLRPQYNELAKEFYLSLPDGEVDVETAAILSSKLRQFCSGAMFSSDEDRTVLQIHDLKIAALRDIREITGRVPMIVGYDFVPERDKIIAEFNKKGTLLRTVKNFDQDEWDNGLVDMLVAHGASMGHGVNLQHGGNLLTWFSPTWNLELYEQLNGRINPTRQTQSGYNRPSMYYRIYFRDTVEERVIQTLSDKSANQQALLDAVKYSIKEDNLI